MSRYKDQTANTLPLSSEKRIEAKGRRSAPSANKGHTRTYMQSTKKPSLSTSKIDNTASTTVTTVPHVTEKARQHAVLMRIALKFLQKDGLIKRYEVRSKEDSEGPTKLLRIRYEFDLSLWTEDLELK